MACPAATDDLVMRRRGIAAAISGGDPLHAFHMFEHGIDAPEAATGKHGEPIGGRASLLVHGGAWDACRCVHFGAGGCQTKEKKQGHGSLHESSYLYCMRWSIRRE